MICSAEPVPGITEVRPGSLPPSSRLAKARSIVVHRCGSGRRVKRLLEIAGVEPASLTYQVDAMYPHKKPAALVSDGKTKAATLRVQTGRVNYFR